MVVINIKPRLFFGIDLKFDLTLNQQLDSLSSLRFYDVGLKKYVYIFPAAELNKVISLIGKEFDFDEQKDDIINLLQHAPSLKEYIEIPRWKGKGELYIQKFPKMFLINTIISKQPQTFRIQIETVQSMWDVLKNIKKGEELMTRDVAEKHLKSLGINRYHKDTGYFKFNALFGERKDYFHLVYYPLKVLQYYELIEYSKKGAVSRLKDDWDIQGEIL